MQSHGGATAVSHHSSRPKKPKSREVSSRFLSPITISSTEFGNHQSPNNNISPLKQKPRSSTGSRKHKNLENSGFLRGPWPSSSNSKPDTLADCIGNDRFKDLEGKQSKEKSSRNLLLLNRQSSSTEFSRFENEKKNSICAKENNNRIFGGYRSTGKVRFSKSSKPPNFQDENDVLPGRISVDENLLRGKSFSRGLSDSDTQDSGSEYSDVHSGDTRTSLDSPSAGKYSPASYMAPTLSSRKHGINVPSRFLHDASSRSQRLSSDQNKGSGKWSSPPGRSASPKAPPGRSVSPKAPPGDNKGRIMGLTSSKPPTSPSKGNGIGKGVGSLLSLGIQLFKGRKASSSASSSIGLGSAENVHRLKLLHNRLMQWRYSNARAEAVNGNVIKQNQKNGLHVFNGLIKLQHSVLQKKLQLQRQKLDIKLNYILHSQIKALGTWANMEGQHSSAVSNTTDCLHSVVCMIPLVDDAKVEPQSTFVALRHASDLAASINLMLTSFSPTIEKTVGEMADLAIAVIQEKQLLEECLEIFKNITALEIQERSLKSSIMQLRLLQQE